MSLFRQGLVAGCIFVACGFVIIWANWMCAPVSTPGPAPAREPALSDPWVRVGGSFGGDLRFREVETERLVCGVVLGDLSSGISCVAKEGETDR